MYWQNNTIEMLDVLVARIKEEKKNVSPFDAECLADVEAARN
jgi:hypothetical protein